ncbi:MAG: SDR family oxidoreductase [Porticoccaceae bacterium]|nr:SDR family oxidoreductase [Porticoccaceae bacterium]
MTAPEKPFGLDDEELIDQPTIFEDGLFKDKTVIISGGGTGIGRGIAYLFARLGANVVICGRKIETLTKTAEGICKGLGIDIATHVMSIREPEAVTGLFDRVWEEFGGLDLLINNGGGQFPQDSIDNSINGWNAVIDTNLNGTWYMMQTAARRWRDAEQPGNIINIVLNIDRGTRQTTHTCAARAGVIYLSKSVAVEWAPLNIQVNCVSPGAIASYGFRVYPPEAMAKFKDSNPMRRTGNVWDIAEACAYLGSPASNFVTGEVLTVDGGNQMWGESWAFGEPEYFVKGRGGVVES